MTYQPTEAERATLPVALLNALAAPHTHEVLTKYADGRVRRFTTRNLTSAEMHAVIERRKIGRDLTDRETLATVRVVAVVVRPIADAA